MSDEVENNIALVQAVCTETNWRQKYGFHQVHPALTKLAQWARLGYVAERRGLVIVKGKDGNSDLAPVEKKVENNSKTGAGRSSGDNKAALPNSAKASPESSGRAV